MDRNSESFRAEFDCDIFAHHGADIVYKVLVKAGAKMLVESGGGGAFVVKHLSGSMFGRLLREVAGVPCPLPISGATKCVGATAQDDLVYACRDTRPRRVALRRASENDWFIDAFGALRGLPPAERGADPVVVAAHPRPGKAETAGPAAGRGLASGESDRDAICGDPDCHSTDSVAPGPVPRHT